MGPAYDAIEAWIIDQGGQPEGPALEFYHTDPDEEPNPSTGGPRSSSPTASCREA
jgi:hypothetical protein